ncbi:MAG: Ppx/GppA family phosphatase [Caulobacteraceae bacterium]|nr:Ppx/GppA family phosphatase [Caulobacteraceae bacterium]
MPANDSSASHSDVAVIDVGSNSVRLVLYRLDGRAVWTVFNEKVLAGLGRGLAETGRLSQDGTAEALTALRRFRALIDASRPKTVFAAATAAVREARDGAAFARRVEADTGLSLRILTGPEEAHYAGLGVIAGAPQSKGLVGDLGGASLELVRLMDGAPETGITLPLGPFSFADSGKVDAIKVRAAVGKHLGRLPESFHTSTFNAVGGAWRNLALVQMRISNYPLRIVHQYALARREALDIASFVSRQSRGSLERIEGMSKRRAESLPHAAVVLGGLIEDLDIEQVVVSAYGLREGLLFESLAPQVRGRDPLIEGCAALGGRRLVAEALGSALEDWLAPAFGALPPVFGGRDTTLMAAACRLAEMGAQLHPDNRAELIFEQVVRAPIPGMTHAERLFLACAVFARHASSTDFPHTEAISRLLSDERLQRARAVGAAIRLGCDVAGRSPDLLARTTLSITEKTVLLGAEPPWAGVLLGEQCGKRGTTLADLLGLAFEMKSLGRPARAASIAKAG